jgi:hypothetical protein
MNLLHIFSIVEDCNLKKGLIMIILDLYLKQYLTDIIMNSTISMIGI